MKHSFKNISATSRLINLSNLYHLFFLTIFIILVFYFTKYILFIINNNNNNNNTQNKEPFVSGLRKIYRPYVRNLRVYSSNKYNSIYNKAYVNFKKYGII